MTWILVFWLATPDNFATHTVFVNQQQCEKSAEVWNQRFFKVGSRLVAECRLT